MSALGVGWADLTATQVYTVHELHSFFGIDSALGTVTRFWDHNAHFNANWGEWLPLTPEIVAEAPNITEITNEGGEGDFAHYWTSTSHVGARGASTAVYINFGRSLGWMENRRTEK